VDTWAFLEHLQRLGQRLIAVSGPMLRERGLASGTMYLLAAVDKHPHPSDLARELQVGPPTVSRLLKGLEAEGYVVRATVQEDLRRYRFGLTPAGRELLAELRRQMQEAVGTMLARLSESQRVLLGELLARVAAPTQDPALPTEGE